MAQIRKRGESYQIIVFVGYDSDQKPIVERRTYKPEATTEKAIEKEVNDFARDFEKRVKDGEVFSGEKTTFAQFVEIWKENCICDKTLRVREEYERQIRRHFIPVMGHLPLSKIRATHIDKVLHDMRKAGNAPKSIRYTFTAINSVMKYAYKKGYIKENPCGRCDDLPKVSRDTDLHYFTVDQAKRFLNALTLEYEEKREAVVRRIPISTVEHSGRKLENTEYAVSGYTMRHEIPFQWRAYFNIAIYGGFRRGEIVALTWEDINYDARTISINKAIGKGFKEEYLKDPKTKSGIREITLPSETFRILREWYRKQKELCMLLGSAWEGYRGKDYDKNYIFIDLNTGKRMNIDTPTHKFPEILELYNTQIAKTEDEKLPKIRLHDLRHTSATLLLSENVDVETVSKRLGHSKASVTLDIYGHALPEKDRTASDTLEKLFAIG